ncbi:hypothetical protein [Nocardioides sp.]|uniref:hypothetical protein n=1 Tax=Nocardioides sp. TaxID=35761 RepID=UPI0037836794
MSTLSPEASTLIGAGELGMLAELVPLIAPEHLESVRQLVRNDLRWPNLTPGLRLLRAEVLCAVCQRLAEVDPGRHAYYVAAGDIPPEIPADASTLVLGEDR